MLQVFPPTRPRFLSRAEPGWRQRRREDRRPRVLPDGRQERYRGDVQRPGGGPGVQELAMIQEARSSSFEMNEPELKSSSLGPTSFFDLLIGKIMKILTKKLQKSL